MTALFIATLNMSITASVVALFVILIRLLLKKAPKIYSYMLWGVVLFRMLCPINFDSSFGLMPKLTDMIPQDIIFYDNLEMQSVLFTNYLVKYEIDTGISNTIPPNMPLGYLPSTQNILRIAKYIWPCGVTVLLLYAVIGYVRLKRRVYYATVVRDNIYETDHIETPFVFGLINPRIYIPVTIDPSKHDYIIEHEQHHIRRRDYMIKPVTYFALALHWFNPLMWLCYFLMSEDMEMSCDEAVLQKSDNDIREEYSTSLLLFSSKRSSIIYPMAFGENNAKSRIKNVLYFKKPAAWVVISSFLIIAPFSVGFSFNADLSAIGQNVIRIMDSEEIESIGILAVPPYQKAVIEDRNQIREITDFIKALEIQRIYFPINSSNGQLVQYEIYMNSGEMTIIGIYGNHIVINGQWYIANDEICEFLSVLGVHFVGSKNEYMLGDMVVTGITVDNYETNEEPYDFIKKISYLVG